MEYQVKKTQILSQVQFTNLLSFSLVQNKLQRNFRNIVEALMLNQAKTDALNEDHILAKQQNEKQFNKIKALLQQMNNKLQNIQNQQKNSQLKPSLHSLAKLPSHKQVQPIFSKKDLPKITNSSQDVQGLKSAIDNMNQKMNGWQNKWDDERAQLLKQIQNMKDKLDSVGFLQNQLKNLRTDLRIAKDEMSNGLKNNNTASNKGLVKRESILNLIANKNTDKAINEPSRHSIKAVIKEQNKENLQSKQNQPNLPTQNTNNKEDGQQNNANQLVQKQINSLYLELNTLKISFEELRDLLSDNRKQIYKNNSLLSEMKDDLNRQVKTRKTQTQDLQKALKDLKMQMLNMQTISNTNNNQTEQKGLRQSAKTAKGGKKDDDDINFKNHLNDKISRLQAMLQNLITESQFNRLKNDLNDQLQKLSGKIQTMDSNLQNTEKKLEDLIVQYQVNTNSDLAQLKNRMSEQQQNLKNESNQNQRKNNILNAKIQQLKKSLQNLRQDIQFYQSLMSENNKGSPKIGIKEENTQQNTDQDKQKGNIGVDDKALQALKKYFSGKMHDLRTNLLGLIRDLQKKMNNKSSGEQQVVKIWDRLNQLNLFINKKADQDDAKKTFLYLEKQINRLNGVLFKSQDNTQDARIARSNNWYCLSCDKNLQTYQGKIGKHVVWDSMPLKGINKSFVNQPDDKKKGLPQLKK